MFDVVLRKPRQMTTVLSPLDPFDHRPDGADLNALLGQILTVVSVAPPVPASIWIGVEVAPNGKIGREFLRLGGVGLRIEHQDAIGVRPFVDPDALVEDVAQRLGGLFASVEDDLQAARLGAAGLAGFRHIEVADVRKSVFLGFASRREFALVEGDDTPSWRRRRRREIGPVNRLQFITRLIVVTIVDVRRLVEAAGVSQACVTHEWPACAAGPV